MAISKRVQRELVQAVPTVDAEATSPRRRRRHAPLPTPRSEPLKLTKAQRDAAAARSKGKAWTHEEHQRFLDALERFPSGPWKAIAAYIGTKNSRQTMTHAQKCREKHERKTRGLRSRANKKAKKSASARRRRPSTRRSARVLVASTNASEQDQDSDYQEGDDNTDEGEEVEDDGHEDDEYTDLTPDRRDDADAIEEVMDEATFFSGCEDILSSAGDSPPSLSLLSLPETLLFASDDLWHSQSLNDMKMSVDDDANDATDLEDLHEISPRLSQECW